MRDANGNQFAGSGPLKDANGHEINLSVGPAQGPVDTGAAETLRLLKIEYGVLLTKYAKLAGEYDVLKSEHDETLKDIAQISDAHQAIQSEHAALKEANALIVRAAGLQPEESPAGHLSMGEAPAAEIVSNVAAEPFPLDQEG